MNITILKRIMLIPMLATLFINVAMASTLNQPSVLWHNSSTGAIKFMPVNGMTPGSTLAVVDSSNTNLLPKGMGDFTGDGQPDILFHNQNSGNLRIWEMDGTVKGENIQVLGSSNTNLQIAGVGDFDGDGDNDIATFNTNSGSLRMWVMEGTTRVDNILVLSGANVNLVPRGAGDMDGDGIPDIVLRNNNSGAVRVWTMNSDLTRKGNEYVTGSSNTNLELRGVTDINGDGNNDILNYNVATGKLRAWLMDGSLGIIENAEIVQDAALEWSVRGGDYLKSSAIAYILEKDANNKIFMEKADNGDFVTTELKNGKYTATKILVNGDTNVFEIEYQVDGIQLTYKGETEFIAIDDATQDQEIESQYIGIWREDVDEDWEGDIDIAYIYTDKAIVFSGNIATNACSQTRTLNVSEFQSLLKNDIDVNDYVIATTYKSRIETACGSYLSLNAAVSRKSILDYFSTSDEKRDTDLESNFNDVVDSSRRGPIDGLYGATVAGTLIDKMDDKIRSKDNWWPIRGAVWIYDKFKAVPKRITTIVGDTADKVNSIYDTISGKNNNNDISGIKDAVDDFEDNSYIDNGNPFEDSTFRYAEKDENGEIEVVESISYDTENKKVEEVPNYDANGNLVSITKRTYLGDDAFGAVYEEETICNTGYILNGNECTISGGDLVAVSVDGTFTLTGDLVIDSSKYNEQYLDPLTFDVLTNDSGNLGDITYIRSNTPGAYASISEDKKSIIYGGFYISVYDTDDQPAEVSFTYTVEDLISGNTVEATANIIFDISSYSKTTVALVSNGNTYEHRNVYQLTTALNSSLGYNTLQINGTHQGFIIKNGEELGLQFENTYKNGKRHGTTKSFADNVFSTSNYAPPSSCATTVGQYTDGKPSGTWSYYEASWAIYSNYTPCNITSSYNYDTDKETRYDYDGNVITY